MIDRGEWRAIDAITVSRRWGAVYTESIALHSLVSLSVSFLNFNPTEDDDTSRVIISQRKDSFLVFNTMCYNVFVIRFPRLSVRYDCEEKGEKEKETKWVLKRHVSFVYTDLLSSFNIAPRSYLRSKHFPFYSLSNSFRSSTGIAIRCKSTIVSDRRSKNSTREKKKKKKGKKRKEKKENFVPRSGELRGWCIDIRTLKVWWPRGSFFFLFFFFIYIYEREKKRNKTPFPLHGK